MERGTWTDQRLNDRFDHIDAELGELRQDVRDLRTEMREMRAEMRAELRGEIAGLRTGLRGEIADLRSLMFRLHATTLIAMLGVFAAFLARGG